MSELILSTPFQALGYVNAPNDTWVEWNGGVEFRTGDYVTRQFGTIVLEGRQDRQVKIRGVRISLGDVESVLRSHEGVIDAVADVLKNSHGEPELVAALHCGARRPSALDLRRTAAESLPNAGVPSRFIFVAQPFSTTSTGKTDRRTTFAELLERNAI